LSDLESIRLSVIITASDSQEAIAQAVSSLLAQEGLEQAEMIVAACPSITPLEGVRWIQGEVGGGVPRLRRLGLTLARAQVVVWTEDSCRFQPGWINGWLEAFQHPNTRGATGSVEPATGQAIRDWAVFFCEYAPFLKRKELAALRPPDRLAGNNFAVRIAGLSSLVEDEIHETLVFAELNDQAGNGLVVEVPEALVTHVRRFGLREALHDRLRFGLEYGQMRARLQPGIPLMFRVLSAPLILLIQFGRISRAVWKDGRYRIAFLKSIPLVLAMLSAWSLGESLGWALGQAEARPITPRAGSEDEKRGQTEARANAPVSPLPRPGYTDDQDAV